MASSASEDAAGARLAQSLSPLKVQWDSLPAGVPQLVLFCAWAVIFRWSGCDQVFFIVSIMALIFGPGLASRSNGPSAYSIFNPGQQHLRGDLRAEQLDAEQRGDRFLMGHNNADDNVFVPDDLQVVDTEDRDEPLSVRSRDANRPCSCGSGRKAKKCCFALRSSAREALLDQWRSEMESVSSGCSATKGEVRQARRQLNQ